MSAAKMAAIFRFMARLRRDQGARTMRAGLAARKELTAAK
jgi:hypothetical protein